MKTYRNYKFKDVEMLLAAKTITGTLGDNLTDLSIVRKGWDEEYVTNLKNKIDQSMEDFLGLDKKKELRDATEKLSSIQTPAMRDLSFLKTQIEVDFGTKAKKIIKNLGFENHLRNAQYGNQESLIQLLFGFKKGLTPKVQEQIVAKGTSPQLLERIISYANLLMAANVSQETLKETTKEITEDALQTFNEIYNQVIGICKIASIFYQYDRLKKEQFTFSKVVSNMNAAKRISDNMAA